MKIQFLILVGRQLFLIKAFCSLKAPRLLKIAWDARLVAKAMFGTL